MTTPPELDPAPPVPQREETAPSRKTYEPPALRVLGTVGQVILSPSPGTFESGYGGGFKEEP
jgi:hypothetical protein